jgi:Uma2 family endonuclease
METVPAPAIEDTDALVRPITLKLPVPLDDEAMLWLSANNETFGFEQTAEGDLVVSPPTNSPGNHGELRLVTQLMIWNDRTNYGAIRGIEGGVELPKGGKREPDAFAVIGATWNALPIADRKKGYVPVLPNALFELLSPKSVTAIGYTKEFQVTLDDYERSAVPLVVLLDPRAEHAVLKRAGKPDDIRTEKILTFPELPGLELDVGIIYWVCNNP